jgi:CheY-like chemotaxis protein
VVGPDQLDGSLAPAPHVIVIDEGAGIGDAAGLTERVRSVWPPTPILLLSAHEVAPLPDDERFAELVKPVRRSAIYNALTALLTADHEPAVPVVADAAGEQRFADPERQLLLAEDDRINQRVAVTMLNKLGYSVVVAKNGREAVELGKDAHFAAVLMDCQMPELDGYEATREIRRNELNGAHTPIIAMTAHSMTTDRTKCLSAGMDDYISKPVRPAELQAVLARWLPAASVS